MFLYDIIICVLLIVCVFFLNIFTTSHLLKGNFFKQAYIDQWTEYITNFFNKPSHILYSTKEFARRIFHFLIQNNSLTSNDDVYETIQEIKN